MFDLEKLVRKNILTLKPYSSARDDFKGNGSIFLDANENSFGSPVDKPFNRYPDPLQLVLKKRISTLKCVDVESIFVGNGSDEPIDLLVRIFCAPNKDNIIVNPPTYGMYEVVAGINDVAIKCCNLADDFQLDIKKILSLVDEKTKMIFVCTPNNPTGNAIKNSDVEELLRNFDGIVVADEAYIDFSGRETLLGLLNKYPNLIVMQTFSKAWGLAGLRVGMAFASPSIISLLNKVKFPYNVNEYSQQTVLKALDNEGQVNKWIAEIVVQRDWVKSELERIALVAKVYPSDSNFILFQTPDALKLYKYLIGKNIVVRDRSSAPKCENCLRVTIGTHDENKALINALKEYL